jgi:transposase
MIDARLKTLSPQFVLPHPHTKRPSIAPGQLLRALLPQVLYTMCGERLLTAQLKDKQLFRWCVDFNRGDLIGASSTFRKNRECLLAGEVGHTLWSMARRTSNHLTALAYAAPSAVSLQQGRQGDTV